MKQQPPQKGKKQNPPRNKAKQTANMSANWMIGLALLFTLIAYIPSFTADFVSWDDGDYVTNNLFIRSFSNFNDFFTTPVQGNYHPLTMMSLALNYAISGDDAWSYHVLNILLHMLNIFLVYRFILTLSKGNNFIAFTVAMLFGIHPMHVESVAWVAERKDVLYSFFFLLGLIYYLKYIEKPVKENYFIVLGLFILSLASKPAAITFPLALFTIDFYRNRKFTKMIILEKIPLFVFSAIFIFLAVHGQTNVGAVDTAHVFGIGSRLLFATFAYMMYFLKMIVPINLAPLYPFPAINESLPLPYFLSPLFFIATVILCYVTWRKNREITFGFAFFLVNLLLILQLKIVGSAVIADRYTYIPYIGLFFIIGWLLNKGRLLNISFNPNAIVISVGIIFTIVSYNQAATWHSNETLWTNAVSSHPSATALINRAIELRKAGKRDEALALYNTALKMNKQAYEGFFNRGNIYFDMNQDSLALKDYNMSLSIKPDYAPTYDNRGALYAKEGRNDIAIADLNKALSLDPNYKQSYKNRAVTYMNMQHYEDAINDFTKFLKYEPKNADIYSSIGVCYQYLGKYDLSLEPFNKAIDINPQGIFYLNRSYTYNALHKINEAQSDARTARSKGYAVPPEYAKHIGI
jgi:tetratricopeptide (TPR) repeat protein